jgi:hypothetical protein
MQQLEHFALDYVRDNRGSPLSIAIAASAALRRPVSRQAVYAVLKDAGYSRKTSSVVPRQSVPRERREHMVMLRMICTNPHMVRNYA